jgi:TolA-binding protein
VINEYAETEEATEAYFRKANIYQEMNRFEDAMSSYEQIIRNSNSVKQSARAQYLLGETQFRQKDYYQAINSFTQVTTQYSKTEFAPKALLKIGKIYLHLQKWMEAKSTFEMIILTYRNSKEYGEAMLGIAQSEFHERNIEEAIHQAQKVVKTQADELKVEALMLIGNCYFTLEEYEKSFETYEKIYSQYKEYSNKAYSAMYLAGLSLEHLGRWNQAANLYKKIIDSPTNMQNYHEASTRLEVIKDKISSN